MTEEEELADEVSKFYADPLGFVMFAFPWDTDADIQQVKLPEKYRERFPNCEYGPGEWACDFLDDYGKEIRKRKFTGRGGVMPIRFATSSGHGIGKTCLVSFIILFIMSTRPNCKGMVTAGTDLQLRTKTWAELGKWHSLMINKHWFNYSSGRGSLNFKSVEKPNQWFCTGVPWRKEDAQAFAGQHAPESTSFYIFDEASQIPEEIYVVREGGLTDGESFAADFGNPTENTGPFFERCMGSFKRLYNVREIDSRSVEITNKELLQEWVDIYGEDSDFVKVRVRGVFPDVGSGQFIPGSTVDVAVRKELQTNHLDPVVLGVDVARFGDDDSCIFIRQGRNARQWKYKIYSGADIVKLSNHVIETVREFRTLGLTVAAIFVDGAGVGGGVVDVIRSLGYNVIEVQMGGSPIDPIAYRYKMDECWGNVREALRTGQLCLPDDKRLRDELTQRLFNYTLKNQVALESKKMMKERGLPSPDVADALALTYAFPVNPEVPAVLDPHRMQSANKTDYDPINDYWSR